jgi:hypothetical protein
VEKRRKAVAKPGKKAKIGRLMIVGVPDHDVLKDPAIGLMNLAWDIAIDEARNFQDAEFI